MALFVGVEGNFKINKEKLYFFKDGSLFEVFKKKGGFNITQQAFT